ncbi:MAG TPA: acetate kinase [Phycisphaerales bacterium]|nr:acetate kinase [Phycisphaerales bacterium]
MKVFVVNCGSSSIKYQLFSMTNERVLAKGLLERVGETDACLHHTAVRRTNGQPVDKSIDQTVNAPNHTEGLKLILGALLDGRHGVIDSIAEIQAVGHRVVHGGEDITDSTLVDDAVLGIIRRNAELAPLHNPPNLAGIAGAMAAMPGKPNVAVFDTAFLATLPPTAYRYAVPDEWYHKHHIRKYGFHGTSHQYVTLRTAELLGKKPEEVFLITAHLGNGCSITAVAGGRAVDHSMGMTPLEGLMMGTRSGDLDPAVVFYMIEHGLSPRQVDNILNKKSGLLGVSGLSNDMRDLLLAAEGGNKRAELAVEMFVYRIVKYIGAYSAVLPQLDAVVLTGGIGENSLPVRRKLCQRLTRLGAIANEQRNVATVRGKAGPITADGATLPVWVVPTNEELMIARDTRRIIEGR